MEAPAFSSTSAQKYPSILAPAIPTQPDKSFKCGCGRSYLSYSALQQHTKIRHQGKFMEYTTKLARRKAGRPRTSNILEDSIIKNSALQNEQPPILISHNFAAEFQSFLAQCPNCRDSNKDGLEERIESLECPQFGDFELEFLRFQEVARETLEKLGEDCDNHQLVDAVEVLVCNPREQRISAAETLGLFMMHISKYVSQEFLSEIGLILTILRKFLDERGWETFELLKTEYRRIPGVFSDVVTAEYLPDMTNVFMLNYFKDILESAESKVPAETGVEYRLLGTGAVQKLRVALLIKNLCHWMYIYKFTSAKMDLVKEYAC